MKKSKRKVYRKGGREEKKSEEEMAREGNRGLRFRRGSGRRGGASDSASPWVLRSTSSVSLC